jgi:chemotaxis protein methyltransferase WspC
MMTIEDLLRQRIGLDAAAIGQASLERLVRLRMKKSGRSDTESYLRLVEASVTEWNELVESVVVAETCFFREREPFAAFIQLVRMRWRPGDPGNGMRILSVPCASGEEPYSIAMALHDAGFPAEQFQIDGVDISRRALERAARGIYRNNSFRGGDMTFRDRHFSKVKDGYLLNSAVRQNVFLRQGNLIEEDCWDQDARYDFIFCRNLLIYFDPEAQERGLVQLRRLLATQGVLFVGPAEVPLVTERGFSRVAMPMAFACQSSRNERMEPSVRPRKRGVMQLSPLVPPALAAHSISTDLAVAGRLADEGKLKEAAEICHAYLRRHKASARAYYLLGLVSDADAESRPQAVDYYQKALYLEPDHYETLWQLALLAQNNGEFSRARVLKLRAERARIRNSIESWAT